ncbi:unnamed protein product [Diabrotica balteata]|uniref:Reverse transcriptase domain-containing protein n=1 Tax=Diabrotica balteata TaxID=107213 RepID=A0A9N9T544_DIABA|nr:unnamed protein product [Diabrotica balteata]
MDKIIKTQRAMERQMLQIRLMDKKRNEWIREKTKVRVVRQEVAKLKWRFAGHNIRQKADRWNKILITKESWLENLYKEIDLQKKNDSFNLHKKLKYTAGIRKQKNAHILKSADGKIYNHEQQCKYWERCITDLVDDASRENAPNTACDNQLDRGPSILNLEVKKAIQQAKNNQAPGPDQIPAELLKLLDEESIACLTTFFNKIYNEGKIPDDWIESLFITLPKKSRPTKCSDFRLINLMSHTLKILLRIIQNRVFLLCENRMGNKQFGFRNGPGTREALFSMRILLQKSCEFRKNKAFDRVQHDTLFDCLLAAGLDHYDIRLLKYLYYNQVASIQIGDSPTEKTSIKRGVRQGCVLSPTFFNLYSKEIFREALDDRQEGVRLGGEVIKNIRYADDTAILAENLQDLKTLLNLTKWMVVGKINIDQGLISLNGEEIERVNHFKYLGSWLNVNCDSDEEIITRIEISRKAFMTWKPVLCNANLSMNIRKKVLKCYVWSILLYDCETWTLKTTILNKRILKISWVSHTSNEDVRQMINSERLLINTIKRRKTEYFGHIIRGPKYHLLRLIIQGKVEGKKWIRRKKLSWLRNIRQWCGSTVEELFRAADRERFQEIVNMMTANV